MKTNIYLTNKQKQELNIIKKANSVSYSTIVDTIATTYYALQPLKDLMFSDIDYKEPNETYYKTSINVKNQYKLTPKQLNQALQMYFSKVEKTIPNTDKLFYSRVRKSINHTLQTTYDEWFNYNAYCHMKERFEKGAKKQ